MKTLIIILILALAQPIDFDFKVPTFPDLTFSQQELYLQQRLTHFDISDDTRWKQRYFKADL